MIFRLFAQNPIQDFDPMPHRQLGAALQMHLAADIRGDEHARIVIPGQCGDFVVA